MSHVEQRIVAIAKHDFEGQSETELSFKTGARITVTKKREPGDWWKGECDGKRGFFPSSFCEICAEDLTSREATKEDSVHKDCTRLEQSAELDETVLGGHSLNLRRPPFDSDLAMAKYQPKDQSLDAPPTSLRMCRLFAAGDTLEFVASP